MDWQCGADEPKGRGRKLGRQEQHLSTGGFPEKSLKSRLNRISRAQEWEKGSSNEWNLLATVLDHNL
jgi:hypothetical protein